MFNNGLNAEPNLYEEIKYYKEVGDKELQIDTGNKYQNLYMFHKDNELYLRLESNIYVKRVYLVKISDWDELHLTESICRWLPLLEYKDGARCYEIITNLIKG